MAGKAHGDLAEFVLLGTVRGRFAGQSFDKAAAKRDLVSQQRSYVLPEQCIATAQRIVERYCIGGCVAATARRAAVRGMAACATAAAVLVGTENVISCQTGALCVGLRRGHPGCDHDHEHDEE